MRTLVKIKFGSHLYGTNTPTSDLDFKSVVIPDARDIVLQRAKNVVQDNTKLNSKLKNTADDIDNELISLHKFMQMLEVGDMIASELLFAPESSFVEDGQDWDDLLVYRPRLIHKQVKGFVSYCQKQAAKYGIKGSRVGVMRDALELLNVAINTFGPQSKIGEVIPIFIEKFVIEHTEHTEILYIEQSTGAKLPHWVVCERKIPYGINLFNAKLILQKVFDNYGHRALQAEQNEGVDFKALSHAVRVGEQAIELLNTGNIIFPRPNWEELLAIKLGKVPYKEIAPRLEELLVEVEAAASYSKLNEEPDKELMDQIVYDYYVDDIVHDSLFCKEFMLT